VQYLKNNRHNQVTTTYYLMLKKRERDGTLPLPMLPPAPGAATVVKPDAPAQTPRLALPDGDQGAGNGRPVPKLDLVSVKPGVVSNSVDKSSPAGMQYNLNPPTFRGTPGAVGHRYHVQQPRQADPAPLSSRQGRPLTHRVVAPPPRTTSVVKTSRVPAAVPTPTRTARKPLVSTAQPSPR
jgi:hypothetical protein